MAPIHAQRHLMEVTPVAPGRLLDGAGLLVGDACSGRKSG